MKKTTLFTTLALVVIVAIALSTATFAWYSANNSVEATTTLQANAASSSNLLISEEENANYATSLSIADYTTLQPACPNAVIAYNTASTAFWNMKVNGDNNVTSVDDSNTTDIFIKTIYVKNDATDTTGATAAHVQAAVTITPDASEGHDLAAGDIEWVLISVDGVIVSASAYDHAAKNTTIATNGSATDTTSYTETSIVNNNSKTVDISAGGHKAFKLFVWLNKNADNTNALGKMAVSVVFSTSATVLPIT